MLTALLLGLGLALNEWYFSARRVAIRDVAFAEATARARELGRPLVVVGAPDGGPTAGPWCGDVTIDIQASNCPRSMVADICEPLPLPDASVVVLVMCVLELVEDIDKAMTELRRVSGGELFVVRVEPWTLTAYLYPGAKRTLPASLCVEAPRNWRKPLPR